MPNCSRDWPARCGGRGGRPDSARSPPPRGTLTRRLAGQFGVGVRTMETVIAGVDGSETALEAAMAAAELSKRLGANLHLVMAIGRAQQQTVRGGGGESWTINSFTAAEQKLSGLVGQIRGGPGVRRDRGGQQARARTRPCPRGGGARSGPALTLRGPHRQDHLNPLEPEGRR